MTFRKCLFLAACLIASETEVGARPLPVPVPQPASLQHAEPSLPVALYSPQFDLLLLAALGWWLWRVQRNRGEESRFFRPPSYYETPLPPASLRTVVYPSDAQTRELRRFRDAWIEAFKSLQGEWSKYEKPVFKVRIAEPADSWREDEKEHVTVHFVGELSEGGRKGGHREFDEFWTFSRDWKENSPWIVTAIRRGNRERSLPRLA